MLKKIISALIISVSLLACQSASVQAQEQQVYLGGQVVGIALYTDGLFVSDTVPVKNSEGKYVSPASEAGIRKGDYITFANGIKLDDASNLDAVLKNSGGNKIKIKLRRNGKEIETSITPVKSEKGYMLGLWMRDSAAGLGTVTFVDAETKKAYALGHGICDEQTGAVLELGKGRFVECTVTGVTKGKKGQAGELRGVFGINAQSIGKIEGNLKTGLVGTMPEPLSERKIPISSDIKVGEAEIYSDFDGKQLKKYTVEITAVNPQNKEKGIVIKITDPELLEKTGGIVQGMSGSPIVQNGKLVGAITHVMLNDSTRGYGIFIGNMLETAQSARISASTACLKEAS